MTDPTDVTSWSTAFDEARMGCCDDNRKPCEYHDGWAEGYEQAQADAVQAAQEAAAEVQQTSSETNRQTDTSRLSDFDGGDTPFDGAAADRRLGDMRRGADAEPVRACGPYCGCNDKEQNDE